MKNKIIKKVLDNFDEHVVLEFGGVSRDGERTRDRDTDRSRDVDR